VPESTTGVVDLDAPTNEPTYTEPEGLTLDQVDEDFNLIDEPTTDNPPDPSQEVPPAPEAPWWTEHADKTVTVKVGGKDVDVPFKEALMGYQRQQDYTMKTTQLADMRKAAEWGQAMQDALRRDPARTLSELAGALGIGVNLNADPSLGEEVLDPDDLRFAQLQAQMESRIEPLAAEVEVAKMQRELNQLTAKYGEDFDATEVISLVGEQLSQGRDISFEQAFHMLQGQKALTARREAAEKTAREKAARGQAAKVSTQQVNRPNPAARSVSHLDTDKELTLRDIFNMELEGVN